MSEKNRPRHKERLDGYAPDDESAVEGFMTGGKNHQNRIVRKGKKERSGQPQSWLPNT